MANKRVQVSDNAGTNWYTLPGNTGDLTSTMSQVDDTVFGQGFQSQQPNLGDWKVTANGLFKGVSGYNVSMKKPGTPTTTTAEACTEVSAEVYQITNAAHRVLSYLDALTVFDNAVDKTAQVESIDYLSGTITFLGTYVPTGPVTLTGKYIPLVAVAKANGFTLSQTCAVIDDSTYADAQTNGGFKTQNPGLNTVTLEVDGIFEITNSWQTLMLTRGIVYIEIDLDVTNAGKTVARGFFKINSQDQSGQVGATEVTKTSMSLWVPDGSLVIFPFNWYFSSSPLNLAMVKCLTQWQNQALISVRYLPFGAPDGTSGSTGLAVVSECTLANTISGMNEFTLTFMGSSGLTPV